jgi:hypothetical protein
MRLAWTLPSCIIVAVGVAASVAAGWFGWEHESPRPSESGSRPAGGPTRPAEKATYYSGQPYTQVGLSGNSFIARGSKPLRQFDLGPRADVVLHDNRWRAIRAR